MATDSGDKSDGTQAVAPRQPHPDLVPEPAPAVKKPVRRRAPRKPAVKAADLPQQAEAEPDAGATPHPAVEPEKAVAEGPVAETPAAAEPAGSESEVTAEEPAAEASTDEPPAEAAIADEPVPEPTTDEPTRELPADEPTRDLLADEPTVVTPREEPTAELPAEEPTAELPAEEPPAEESVEEQPTTEQLVAEEPATEQPVAEEPTAERPVAEEPVADQPVAEEPTAQQPVAPVDEPVAVAEERTPSEPPPALGRLATALSRLRATIGGTAYPLAMPSAEEAERIGAALVSQLDDYLLPRLARIDAPLLVVVGGSTGAGKSTLVNSLVRTPVSTAGVLRPTTRSPVLVSNPVDLPWFRQGQLLPGLVRTPESSADPRTLQIVSAPALAPGLAFLDAPDIDSVVDRNRALAAQLLAAADLWLFVTTAARYADAVPWELLTTARLRGTVIALVLDRVPAEAAADVSAHLHEMLTARNLGAAPLFVLPETRLDGQGLISEETIKPLSEWFGQLAADANARGAVVRQTLDGALAALGPAVAGLAEAADEQARAAKALDERVIVAFKNAKQTVVEGLRDGHLMRGEVLARWQEFVGTGEFLRTLESKVGLLRDRIVAAVTGRPMPGRNLQAALESQLVTLLRAVAADATEQAYAAWQAHPAGAALLDPDLQHPSADLAERADRLVREWQRWVLSLVRQQGGEKRVVARGAAYAVNGAGLAVMIAVFTSTAFIPTGIELAVGAGTTVAAQKVLEAIFGDQAIRTLATRAREDLLIRAGELLDEEAARFTDRTAATGIDTDPGADLRTAAAEVEAARGELGLTRSGS